ncbi:MAG TPA: rhomboid family intramembrane serine protease [Allosphingosinicella sp.]|jgi:membrane associated rhomboid family serine protease|nr:rhomboid family intramembrane serine protease [Allosphingosinicella sp.]
MRPPDDLRAAPVTLAIAAVTAAAWLIAWALGREEAVALAGGFTSAHVAAPPGAGWPVPVPLTPLTATLVHSGFVHLFFNLIMLLFCGRSVERVLGGRGMAILYLVGAYAAAAAEYPLHPDSTVPMVGASGAISAVLGAFALLFGRNKVKIANPSLATLINALWLGAAWIVLNILIGLTFETSGLKIAVAAHIGGFLAGLVLAKPLLLLKWRGA